MVFLTGPVLILLVSLFRRNQARRWQDFATVIGFVVYLGVGGTLQYLIAVAFPHTCDAALSLIDARFGFSTQAFATAIARYWWAMIILILTYTSLSLVIGLAWVIEQDAAMRRGVAFAGCFCFVCYAAFPAVGPVHFDWARQVPEFAPRNAMPSLHLTWTLLLAINARSRKMRIGLWSYAGLTAVSTLALREHYLVDLFAALPYTLAMQWMAVRCPGWAALCARLKTPVSEAPPIME